MKEKNLPWENSNDQYTEWIFCYNGKCLKCCSYEELDEQGTCETCFVPEIVENSNDRLDDVY